LRAGFYFAPRGQRDWRTFSAVGWLLCPRIEAERPELDNLYFLSDPTVEKVAGDTALHGPARFYKLRSHACATRSILDGIAADRMTPQLFGNLQKYEHTANGKRSSSAERERASPS